MGAILDVDEVRRRLERVREVTQGAEVIDAHVHPLEVLRGGLPYMENPEHAGLLSADASAYVAPAIGPVKAAVEIPHGPEALRAKFFLLTVRRLYAHVGPPMLGAQMAISGIGRSLLLPVALADPAAPDTTAFVAALFGGDPRFVLGYSLPSSVADDDVIARVGAAVEEHGIRVIKIHPGVTGIDLGGAKGVRRVETILQAAQDHGLGVVIHAGLSPFVEREEAVGFGCLAKLGHVDWCITKHPVVFAHAGAFGHDPTEIADRVLPEMDALLGRGDHLMVDVSALDVPALAAVLARIELRRVVFGSDAQYFAPWESLVRLVIALDRVADRPDDALLAITCSNPARLLGEESR